MCIRDRPGPVFVKGFLRCCARSLGVEPETVMELVYERERAMLVARRKERPVSAPQPVTPAAPEAGAPAPSAAKVASAPRLFPKLPTASTLLWVVVALFVAMVMMAAFNLIGASPLGPT